MKSKRQIKYPRHKAAVSELKEAVAMPASGPMIRTQIYLSREEHDFLATEARRLDKPMAAIIRQFIDEKMEIPDDAWTNNPMLEPTPDDPNWKSPRDAAVNLDHYLYGSPKKWIKVKSKYVESPALPDDYYDNAASAQAYDKKLRELDETK
jgi:hypothetical protein